VRLFSASVFKAKNVYVIEIIKQLERKLNFRMNLYFRDFPPAWKSLQWEAGLAPYQEQKAGIRLCPEGWRS
jgi:hypothetical protein